MNILSIFKKKPKGLSPSFLSLNGLDPKEEKKCQKEEAQNAKIAQSQLAPPYLSSKRTWNSYHQSLMAGKRLWQIIAVLALLITFASIAGIIHIGLQSKFIPYVVEVDKHGQAVAVSPADRARPVDERIIHAQLASFIHDARLVTPDVDLQTKAIYRVYSMLDPKDPATLKLNNWFNDSEDASPFKRAERFTVSVAIQSVMPLSAESWQIDWVEKTYERGGKLEKQVRMRALLNVYLVETTRNTTIEQLRRNPCGLFIKDLSWSEQLNQ